MKTTPQTIAALLVGALLGSMVTERCTRTRRETVEVVRQDVRCAPLVTHQPPPPPEVDGLPLLWWSPQHIKDMSRASAIRREEVRGW